MKEDKNAVAETKEAPQKEAKKDGKKKAPNKKPNIFVRFGRKMKEVFSELKKVTWPTFPKVIKNTGVVLAVVLVFLLVITGIDAGLLALMKLVQTFRVVVQDSYETGGQNFTDDFMQTFESVYGYSMLPYLPAYYGYVVGDQDRSDRFLWDLRRLIADQVSSIPFTWSSSPWVTKTASISFRP